MSHQTGIKPSPELGGIIADAKKGGQRILKVIIQDEQLVLSDKCAPKRSWEDDFDALLQPRVEDKMPCYIFYRMDTKDSEGGFKWLFISYIPDNAAVREKMLYASTKATMKTSFGGSSNLEGEMNTTLKNETTLEGYRNHLKIKAAPGPLTESELERKMVQELETRSDIGVDTKSQTLPGLSFPIEDGALGRIRELRDGKINYVQLLIDTSAEIIRLDRCEPTTVDQLPSRIPDDSARYHLFVFKHEWEGERLNSVLFIYTMPGYRCPVKERMLYSSCKAPLIFNLEQMKMQIAAKIEIDDRNELTEDFLMSEVHPIRIVHKPKFEKPKGPANRKGQSRVPGNRK